MDCLNARLLLSYARPVPCELDASELAELERHLEECPVCTGLDQDERALDASVRPVMMDVPVPDGLQTRLMTRLSVERDAWYRKIFLRVSAVAALLVVGVGLALWYFMLPTNLDVDKIKDTDTFKRTQDYVNAHWLKSNNFRGVYAPPQFRYSNLAGCDIAYLDGHKVPMLTFTRVTKQSNGTFSDFAKVYILSDRDFNLDALRAEDFDHESNGSWTNRKVLPHPDNPHILYFVIYTGKLDSFTKGED